MVGGSLSADDQAFGNLGIGKAMADETQHLQLTLGQYAYVLGSGTSGYPQRTQKRAGSVGIGRSAQFLQRRPSLGDGHLPAGCFDDDPVTRPSKHIFVASKAPWYDIPGDLPRYEERPSG